MSEVLTSRDGAVLTITLNRPEVFNAFNAALHAALHAALEEAAAADVRAVVITGAGRGFVDVFTSSGKLVRRLIKQGPLNAPWGVARAPKSWGAAGGDLLIGNFGDGTITADGRENEGATFTVRLPLRQPDVADGWEPTSLFPESESEEIPHALA